LKVSSNLDLISIYKKLFFLEQGIWTDGSLLHGGPWVRSGWVADSF